MTLNLLVPTPYGDLALTSANFGPNSLFSNRSIESEQVDDCTIRGKLTIEGHDYAAALTFLRNARQFTRSERWNLLRFDNDTSPLPEISNIGLRPWRPEDAREPLDITPEIEDALNYQFLFQRAFTVAYHELRTILLTPDWQRWVELDAQIYAKMKEYQEGHYERITRR